ncbi:aldo/keto reductase [Rubrimonas cliftonensis]|uniref:Predicted oxidoreductase n=1 Tax=Rubrimonas cliftonensis TaxID=89524 RepID=A0A1H4CN81_9RHOB|nr:aldo/keto reductase [Rubrimonas cliftonensis]SEA61780.1 Predicted oxidoreductase [Rubrimonas cliftonensis]
MRTRNLAGLTVPAIGLGCMGMSTAYGEPDDAESTAAILRALDLGVTHFDSADVYGNGHNETLLGAALKGRRDEATIATKVGNLGRAAAPRTVDGRPEHILAACDRSLSRLGVETIDLYYLHRVDPETAIEESVGAMSRLVEAGKVRFVGLSEAGPETLRRACAVHPIAALQSELSLWSRDVEAEILPACRALGVGFVAYAPLGRGFLTGTIPALDTLIESDRRRDHPRFSADNIARNAPLVEAIRTVAAAHDATPAQVAIAWVLSRGEHVATIPGAKRRRWLEENAEAAALTLSPAEIAALEGAFPPGVAAGTRYPEKQMASLGL